ncbi:efflux RND transporter periplasmic adaptor subunit [Clostridium sp. YIM B02555]|uniref:efflux RND transporter periplasmic adaptor subunit n=1 Tax=Clostridium sp. YIM B02555 TaxID=2911968 RepID=UPI001EEE1755|nr:efflux RND transporter periplasmic adaptor subunit [Clostridium sp. YIM B02555]
MKNVKKIVICAVLIIAVVSAIVVKNKMASNAKTVNTVATESKTAVEVKTAKSVEKNNGDTYKATLEAYQQGAVTSKISAKVISVAIENGKYVNAGDIIATLDNQDIQNSINSAQAQLQVIQQQLNSSQVSLQKLQINLDDAQRTYNRQKTLFDGKAISQTDFEAAEKALNNAKADYNTGEASIETAKANLEAQNVSIAKYQSDLANTVLKAPISGVISDKALSVGQMVSAGGVLAKVNDISSVYATIQVPQEKISSIKTGQAATVKIEGNDKAYDGTIQNIEALADTTTRVFNCKIKIDNSDKSLYPGVYAKAELLSSEKTQIITVPINALVGTEGNYSVFINDNGKAKKEKVKIGETDDNNVEINDGIKDGDQIICSNTGTLQDGDTIETSSTSDNSSNGDSAKDVSK